MVLKLLAGDDTGGLPVAPGGEPGAMVVKPGQLQYGDVLMGGGTPAGWRELVGWRDLPDADVSDSPRPQAHGAYPGDVWGGALTVTFTYLVRGTPDAKAAAIATLERYAPMDGVERALVVDDGDGPWWRLARVIGRTVPQDKGYRVGPVECSLQFLCADPRRYGLETHSATVKLPTSSGGLSYPLTYPLQYGSSSGGQATVNNAGSVAAPLRAVFRGPLTSPVLTAPDWTLGFDITLADGETLTVDTSMGTALLNDTADRLYTIRNDSSPLELALLAPGLNNLSLTATAGTGAAEVSFNDARM